jgi:hypothetical protein
MDLRVISKGYFKLTEEEKAKVCEDVLRHYLQEIVLSGGDFFEFNKIMSDMKSVSIQREEYEITDILTTIIEALEELNFVENEFRKKYKGE